MTTDTTDPKMLLDKALASFHSKAYRDCLCYLKRLQDIGASVRGLSYLRACSYLHLEEYIHVLPELRRECAKADCLPEAQNLMQQIEQESKKNPCLSIPIEENGKYLICGLPPDGSGTGRFLATILPEAAQAGYHAIYPAHGYFTPAEKIVLASINNSQILLLHHQFTGHTIVQALHRNGNRLSMYVLDSGFFCMRSYNHRPEKEGECFDCLGNPANVFISCSPSPVRYEKQQNLEFLQWLMKVAGDITFFCQTESQASLMKSHFDNGARYKVVGMKTLEFKSANEGMSYDIVFHADPIPAKGIRYCLALAASLPDLSFLLPCPHYVLEQQIGQVSLPANVTLRDMRWETGLEQQVSTCRLVLCPSQWSAPVEGALLKSLYYNGNVAVVRTKFGFEQELPEGLLIRLDQDISVAVSQVKDFLISNESKKQMARSWIEEYRNKVCLEEIFIEVD